MRHYHVIRNTEGYMPENEPYVTKSFKDAHRAAVGEIKFLREGEWDTSPSYRHYWHRVVFEPKSGYAMWRGSRRDKYALDTVVTIDRCNGDCYEEYQELIEKGYI